MKKTMNYFLSGYIETRTPAGSHDCFLNEVVKMFDEIVIGFERHRIHRFKLERLYEAFCRSIVLRTPAAIGYHLDQLQKIR